MLTLQRRLPDDKCTANVLPCRINHTGPSKVTKRYWNVHTETDGSLTSHFRGRRLRGKAVQIPTEYQGLVLETTEKTIPQSAPYRPNVSHEEDSDNDDIEMILEPLKVIEQVSSFDEMVIWGHDQIPSSDDTFVKGIEEWIAFAEAVHGSDTTESKT